MKHKYFTCIIILLSCNFCFAQKEYNNWRFGNRVGLKFSNGVEIVNSSNLESVEGCAVISDSDGDLLFYTNGVDVWNINNSIMANGSGLFGNTSASQSSLIVKKPGASNMYYIFTLDKQGNANGLTYSEVNMSLNNSLGDVTINKNIQLYDLPLTEKMTFTKHSNGTDYWIIVHRLTSNEFLAYHVSSSGINTTPIISNSGDYHYNYYGTMKVSSNQDRIAATNGKTVEILDFNNTTGEISNSISTYTLTNYINYGLEFSNNGQFLYVSDIDVIEGIIGPPDSSVFQLDISSNDIAAISNSKHILQTSTAYYFGAIQKAINGNIYITRAYDKKLDIIDNPDEFGENCTYIKNGVLLENKLSYYGLPQIIPSIKMLDMNIDIDCSDYEAIFSIDFDDPIDSVLWNFGDGDTSTLEDVSHNYTSSGVYSVTLTVISGIFCKTIESRVVISDFPDTDNLPNLEVCDDDSNDGIEIFDLASHNQTLVLDNIERFNFSYHLNEADAENDINALDDLYQNTTNNQQLYVRIETVGNSSCYVVGPFLLIMQQFSTFENYETTVNINVQEWSPNNNSIAINVEANGTYQYSLNGIIFQDSTYFENLNAGLYTIYVKDFDQCGVYKRQISILNAPSYFTPNGDAINDFWQIKSAYKRPGLITYIYNRFGKLLTTIKANDYGWDGTYNGKPLPQSDYWYVTKSASGNIENTGHFTLKRYKNPKP